MRLVPKTEFGRWLRSNMDARYFNCADVADKLHATRQTIRTHVVGEVLPSYVWVIAYCSLFGSDVDAVWKIVQKDAGLG